MKGIETMVSANHAANNSQNQTAAPPKMHWRHMDILRWCDDTTEAKNVITVTPGKPPRIIWRTHDYCRSLEQVKPLIDAGYIEYLRTEIYAGGASCEIYITSKKGRAAVESYYAKGHEQNAESEAAYQAKRAAEKRENWRKACHAELKKQFGVNLYLPAIFGEISDSNTPFIDSPLPEFAPNNRDGQPMSIREYLIILWSRLLSDEGVALMNKFLTWGDAIGFEEAAAMLSENGGFSAYGLFGLDDTESGE